MKWSILFSAFLSLCLLTGCASRSTPETVTFQIKTTEKTNQGIPLYALVKSTDFSHFLSDDYRKIAHQKMIAEADPTCHLACLIPGETKTIRVEKKDDKPIAIYFIFTQPGEEWKYMINEEKVQHAKILLGEKEIKAISTF
jgi:predicted component of type VI protein secretion system